MPHVARGLVILLVIFAFNQCTQEPNVYEKLIATRRGDLVKILDALKSTAALNARKPAPTEAPPTGLPAPDFRITLWQQGADKPNPAFNTVLLEGESQVAKLFSPFDPNDTAKRGEGPFSPGVDSALAAVAQMVTQGARGLDRLADLSPDTWQYKIVEDEIAHALRLRYAVYIDPGQYQPPLVKVENGTYAYTRGRYETVARVFDLTSGAYVTGFPVLIQTPADLLFDVNAGYDAADSLVKSLYEKMKTDFTKVLQEELGRRFGGV